PQQAKIVITGAGRVAGGAMEILSALRITQIFPKEFLNLEYTGPTYTQLEVHDYFERIDGKEFTRQEFYTNPEGFRSRFMRFARLADIYIPCHFWSERSPYIFTREDA